MPTSLRNSYAAGLFNNSFPDVIVCLLGLNVTQFECILGIANFNVFVKVERGVYCW